MWINALISNILNYILPYNKNDANNTCIDVINVSDLNVNTLPKSKTKIPIRSTIRTIKKSHGKNRPKKLKSKFNKNMNTSQCGTMMSLRSSCNASYNFRNTPLQSKKDVHLSKPKKTCTKKKSCISSKSRFANPVNNLVGKKDKKNVKIDKLFTKISRPISGRICKNNVKKSKQLPMNCLVAKQMNESGDYNPQAAKKSTAKPLTHHVFRESRYKRQLKNSKLKQQQLEATITYNANKIQHRLKISERVPQIYKEEPCPDAPIYADDDEEEEEEKEEEEEQEDIEHNSHFNPLTDEQEYLVSDCFSPSSRDKQFVEGFKLSLTGNDLSCLAGLSWLNDEVINFYMNLIMERGSITRDNQPDGVHCFNTFFYPRLIRNGHQSVKRWTKRLDVLSSRYIVVPVHLGMHWCLAIINFAKKTINYYDSMGGNNDTCLNALRNYVIEEAKDKKQIDYDMSEWTMTNLKDIPQQDNGSDCGMFACKFAEYITRDAPFNFSQKDIPYFRRRMVCELINKELM